MKKSYILALFALCMMNGRLTTTAQGIYQFWGTTENGGTDNQGTVFTTRMDGRGHKVRPLINITNPGGNEFGTGAVVYNSKIYTVAGGGIDNRGTIIAYNPANSTYEKLYDFYSINAILRTTNLVLYNNKMYGVSYGQDDHEGFIFEFDPATKTLVNKFSFDNSVLSSPVGGLMLLNDQLWGCTQFGGNPSNGGIYSYNLTNGVFTERYLFPWYPGDGVECLLTAYSNNRIFGATPKGGANDEGAIFEYQPVNDNFIVRYSFTGGNDGSHANTRLLLYENKLYGAAQWDGANDDGTLFEFNPVTNVFTTKLQLNETNGNGSQAGFTVYNDRFYVIYPYGATTDNGSIAEYNPATNILTKKVNCSFANGWHGDYNMIVYNDKLYGLAYGGNPVSSPTGGGGVLFEYNPVANGMTAKIKFRQNQGLVPTSGGNYYNGKVYGLTANGGTYGNGVIWEYDPTTLVYTVRHNFEDYAPRYGGAMTLYNGKFYGVTDGDQYIGGSLFSFDPGTGVFTILKLFSDNDDAGSPRGGVVVFNNKLYGCNAFGGAGGEGMLWQYDLANNQYAIKVQFSGPNGKWPMGLTEYNGSLYGVCMMGGVNDRGIIFQYFPAINGIQTRFDFNTLPSTSQPEHKMTVVGNKMYGTTAVANRLFEFDPASGNCVNKVNLYESDISFCRSGLTYNAETNKLYGTSYFSGSHSLGTLFEYDITNNVLDRTFDFNTLEGTRPRFSPLAKVPAFVAPGNPGNCEQGSSASIDPSNNNKWVAFTNVNGDAICEINANGNNLGRVAVNYYIHDGATRQKNGAYYLDRNITITVDNQPSTPVSVRLYIRKQEFDKLKNTPGSGINSIGSLSVFKNEDACSNTLTSSAQKLPTTIVPWNGDHVFITSVSSFSTFYFASSSAVLPVHLLSFSGTKEATANKLKWEASCDNAVDFSIERSSNGTNFTQVGLVMAGQQDCRNPFYFTDPNPPVKAYYRLKMTEQNRTPVYSNIILLNREGNTGFNVTIFPNPVVNGIANLQVNAVKKMNLPFTISDAMGRVVMSKEVIVQPGTNSYPLPVDHLGAGIYQLVYNDGQKNQTVRFVKQ